MFSNLYCGRVVYATEPAPIYHRETAIPGMVPLIEGLEVQKSIYEIDLIAPY